MLVANLVYTEYMNQTLRLLSELRHQRVRENWGLGNQTQLWQDLRAMVPLALIGNFSLTKHISAAAACDPANYLIGAFKNGIQDWFRERDLKSCLADSTEWPLWLNEYTQALTISAEHFNRITPAQLTAGVFDEFHNLRHWLSPTFIINEPERLQVALLHIKHLPQDTELYAYDLALWTKAAPDLRARASPEIGPWYNLVQDEEMLRWRLLNGHQLDTVSYALPVGAISMNESTPC